MSSELQQKIRATIQNPVNVGEMEGADAVGTVGSAACGEMLRMWVKFREVDGRKVIDRASFQSFGCETAIAIASLATELIKGKTPEQALSMRGAEFAAELGPLPPMKIHCGELVEGALRSALGAESSTPSAVSSSADKAPPQVPSLMDSMNAALNSSAGSGAKIVLLRQQANEH